MDTRRQRWLKIIKFLYKNFQRIIWDINTDDEYLEQIIGYQEGQEPDDAPDSAASLIREAFDTTEIVEENYTVDTNYINEVAR